MKAETKLSRGWKGLMGIKEGSKKRETGQQERGCVYTSHICVWKCLYVTHNHVQWRYTMRTIHKFEKEKNVELKITSTLICEAEWPEFQLLSGQWAHVFPTWGFWSLVSEVSFSPCKVLSRNGTTPNLSWPGTLGHISQVQHKERTGFIVWFSFKVNFYQAWKMPLWFWKYGWQAIFLTVYSSEGTQVVFLQPI